MTNLFCPVCGTENPTTSRFCGRCAADLRAPVPNPNSRVVARPTGGPNRSIVIGLVVAFALVAVGITGLLLLGGSPAASVPPTPTPTSTVAPSTVASVPPSAPPTGTPTAEPIATPIATPAQTAAGSATPIPSGTPIVDSLAGPGRASCTTTNGTALAGYVKLTWAASNTSGVRLSIDPPAPNKAYDYGYDDYPATGSAEVPFACDPPNSDARGAYHLYVVTTAHDGGYFAYRFIKVYVKA